MGVRGLRVPAGPWWRAECPVWPARRVLALIWLVLLAVPLLAPNGYIVSLGNALLINLILIASLNLVVGFCGQISLGHAGFFGLGAYASGVLGAKYGVPAWAGLPAAGLLAAAAALLIGLPALRLRGHYLAMATLGWNAILMVLFNQLVPLTGGPNGLLGVPAFSIGRWPLDTDLRAFPLVWLIAGLLMLAVLNIVESRTGRALRALGSSEIGAASLGINTFRYKLMTFVVAGGMAGIAGSLYVHVNQFASPETFGIPASILLLVMVALGGAGRYWGPVSGALIYTLVPQLLLGHDDVELLLFGAAMLLVLIVFPGGLAAIRWGVWRRRGRP